MRRASAPTASASNTRSTRPPPPPPPPPVMTGSGGDIVAVAVAELAESATETARIVTVEGLGRNAGAVYRPAGVIVRMSNYHCHVVDEPVHARVGCVVTVAENVCEPNPRPDSRWPERLRRRSAGNRDWRRAGWPACRRRRCGGRGRRAHDDVRRVLTSRVIGDPETHGERARRRCNHDRRISVGTDDSGRSRAATDDRPRIADHAAVAGRAAAAAAEHNVLPGRHGRRYGNRCDGPQGGAYRSKRVGPFPRRTSAACTRIRMPGCRSNWLGPCRSESSDPSTPGRVA